VDRLVEPVQQQVAVGQPGQQVVVDLVFEVGGALRGFGDVVHDADEMGAGPGVVDHRRDCHVVPVDLAVLAQVAAGGAHFAALAYGGVQQGVRLVVHARQRHQPADLFPVGADNFAEAVAGDALEGGVRVFDRMRAAAAARDEDAVAARVQRPFAQAQLFLLLAALRNIQSHAAHIGRAPDEQAGAGKQKGGGVAVAREQVGLDHDAAVGLEHFFDARLHQVALFRREHAGRRDGLDFGIRQLGRLLDPAIPQHQAAGRVDDVEGARQQVDHFTERRARQQVVLAQRLAGGEVPGAHQGGIAEQAALLAALRRQHQRDRHGRTVRVHQFRFDAARHMPRRLEQVGQALGGGLRQQALEWARQDVGRVVAQQLGAGVVPGNDFPVRRDPEAGDRVGCLFWHGYLVWTAHCVWK
jgi:hypothetical protein